MKILLVYPEYPDTFWSFKTALKFLSKKAVHPPLGLLTVAAMLPKSWELELIDLNAIKLKDTDLAWADYVFLSAMDIQRKSVEQIIDRCIKQNKKIVAGGPLFTGSYDEFPKVSHFVLGEAEVTLPLFLEDLKNNKAKRVYFPGAFPALEKTPTPAWHLIKMKNYVSMDIQYSRGCPFNCEFCDITTLFGRQVRTKSKDQIISELESIYERGWRGGVFFVDDNFIGNSKKLVDEVLPAIIDWQKKHHDPFGFMTEASVNLADNTKLMDLMVQAGFHSVFLGIETPDTDSLSECNKMQNKNRDLAESVRKIQQTGLEVTAGFIVGFDNDSPATFGRQIEFIKKTKIVTAMVGMLTALKNTPLYKRLLKENRIVSGSTGNNTSLALNYIPKMDPKLLVAGYERILRELYGIKPYYERVLGYLKSIPRARHKNSHLDISHVKAFLRSIWILGCKEKGRREYWKLFFWSLFHRPQYFSLAITLAIQGYHYRQVFGV